MTLANLEFCTAPEISNDFHSNELSDDESQASGSVGVGESANKPVSGVLFYVRVLVAVTVVVALIYMIYGSAGQLRDSDFQLNKVQFGWLLLAVFAYVVTMVLSCTFWHRVMLALGQQPRFQRSLLAFFVSQLAKYVPGKAMVVVVRTDMIRNDKVETTSAAASVFVETLTWIFVGSAISTALLAVKFRDQTALGVTAVCLAICAGLLTWPPVFRFVANKIVALKSGGNVEDRFADLNLSTMSYGWVVMTIGWFLNGLSLWLVLRGLPGTGITIDDFPLTLLCVALATVAGFVSLLPGGLGVRELVIIPLLGARFGPGTAVVAAIVIRFVWLASEILSSAIIYVSDKYLRPPTQAE